jgi:transmembrane sensor
MADDRAQGPDIDAEWESVARYLAGECDPDETRRVRELLERDAEKGALVSALDAALTIPAEAPLSAEEVESALNTVRARAALENGSAEARDGTLPFRERPTLRLARMRGEWRHAGLRAAAAVLLVAGASMLWRATQHTDPARVAARSSSATAMHYASATRKLDSIRLSDGSRVVLGPSSALNVPAGFGDSTRRVTLTGDAYFEVVHDQRVPFVVQTDAVSLRDVGTTFVVHSDMDGGTRVAVTTGAVDVTAAHAGAAPSVLLHAGDRAVAEVNGQVRVERGVVTSADLSWTHGLLVFRDAPFTEVTVGLRRWFGIELVATDSLITRRRLTATFDGGTPDEVGGVLAAALGGSVRRSGDTLRIGSASPAR